MKGALELLNANGYPIKRGQLYKETSAGTGRSRNSGENSISKNRSCLNGLNPG